MNLVVQGAGIEPADASHLAAASAAKSFEQIGELAWRLRDASACEAVAVYCEARHLDHAWVPAGRRFAGLGLMAMDMDSTLITIECIDEIGGMLGIKAEIAAITERAMRGEIDYAESLERRVALLEGLGIEALDRVYDEKLRLSPGAERLVRHAQSLGIKTLLVSGGFTFFTERLKQRLGLDYTLSNVLEIKDGKLTGSVSGDIVDAAAKAARFAELTRALGLRKDRTLAIGDGANDVPMMAEAGVSVAYRAKPVVRARATHALNHSGLDGVINLFE
jgi:phosphoserine phosphatase